MREKLEVDLKAALKAGDKQLLNVLRMVKSAIRNEEIDKKLTLEDADIINVFQKEIKIRRDTLIGFTVAGRSEKVDDLESEIAILSGYLPQQLDRVELERIIALKAAEINAKTSKDVGRLMKAVIPLLKGQAETKLISEVVNDVLKD